MDFNPINSFTKKNTKTTTDHFVVSYQKFKNRSGVYYLPNQQTPVTAENLCVYESNGQYHSKGKIKDGKKESEKDKIFLISI